MIRKSMKQYVIKLSLTLLFFSHAATAMAINAYIISSDTVSGNAIVDILLNSNINAQLGVATSDWDGTQVDLNEIDAIVLVSRDENTPIMPLIGQQAIVDFVENGGGLILGGSTRSRERMGDYELLSPLFPFNPIGSLSAGGVTFIVNTPNEILDEDIPENGILFFFDSADPLGLDIDIFFTAPGATEYYTYNTPSIIPHPAGLVGWQIGEGQVLAFTNRLYPRELESVSMVTLFRNAVTFASGIVSEYEEICFPISASNNKLAVVCL